MSGLLLFIILIGVLLLATLVIKYSGSLRDTSSTNVRILTPQQKRDQALQGFHPHCIRCGYPLLHEESTCPQCGITIQISPEELNKQQNNYILQNNGWFKASQGFSTAGDNLTRAGRNISKAGNTMTLWITIPILIIVFLLLFVF
ncbi:hypothetical protein [Companilactobacillus ginsenosidimutans]|uniref:Zinc-ribbon domain-containing protein n=1 Tax=Companilactobacillus ginsenosidimutans TaxID=1007676 RepID=A0A0H4QJD8_9LACO|nr:hypothetical protein [Companilactobacillus ginsenosidimutans]AKP66793.1 hypothetical protein ABM34_03900 [Companilactobacillus ginsenosidimutans]